MVNMMRDTDAETIEMLYRKVRFLETVLDELPTPVFAKSADARFCFFNKAYEDFYHVDRTHLLGKTVLDLDHLSRESRERCQREDVAAIRKESVVHYESVCNTHAGPRHILYWSKGFSVPHTGEKGLVGNLVDVSDMKFMEQTLADKITELEIAQAELRRMSYTDPLTGLLNRRAFEKRAGEWMKLSVRHGQAVSMIMMDVDFFKKINDAFGHDIGDAVLKFLAEALQEHCRAEDIVARIGGEEFVILLPMVGWEGALVLAERIRDTVRDCRTFPHGGILTCSFGVTQFSAPETLGVFFKRADDALYQAKRKGRNGICIRLAEENSLPGSLADGGDEA